MKKIPNFLACFIGINLFFIFFLVYKNSVMIKLSFQKQAYEKQISMLLKNKDSLQAQLYVLQNRDAVQEFVTRELHMEKINRKQIKPLPASTV